MCEYHVSTANTGNSITVFHLSESCLCLSGSESRPIDEKEIRNRGLELCGQCDRLRDGSTAEESYDEDWGPYRALSEAADE